MVLGAWFKSIFLLNVMSCNDTGNDKDKPAEVMPVDILELSAIATT